MCREACLTLEAGSTINARRKKTENIGTPLAETGSRRIFLEKAYEAEKGEQAPREQGLGEHKEMETGADGHLRRRS